jgi:O-antigen ligase
MTFAITTNPLTSAREPRGISPRPPFGTFVGEPKGLASQAGFFLFVLVNAVVFIRPTELIPALQNWPVYSALLFLTLVVSLGPVLRQLSWRSLVENPITACVIGFLAAAILSNLGHLRLHQAAGTGIEDSRLLIFYLLLVALVNTPGRLRTFLCCLAAFACVQIVLALLQQYHFVDLAALRPIEEQQDALAHGEVITRYRICGTGIFHDPNDLGVLAATAIAICLYLLGEAVSRRGRSRWIGAPICLAALGLFGRALLLTQSRGAFIAMLAGIATFSVARIGWIKSVLVAIFVLPLIHFAFTGRQANINVHRTTAQLRLGLWSKSLAQFFHSPLLGIGQGRLASVIGQVAHNSFLHGFTETGFFGGTFFLAAFVLALWGMVARTPDARELFGLRACVLAMVAAWVAGMLSLSRSYVPPTFLILGLAAAYLNLAARDPDRPRVRLSVRLALGMAGLSVVYLCGIYVFVHRFHGG